MTDSANESGYDGKANRGKYTVAEGLPTQIRAQTNTAMLDGCHLAQAARVAREAAVKQRSLRRYVLRGAYIIRLTKRVQRNGRESNGAVED